jgi:hypothetical protein
MQKCPHRDEGFPILFDVRKDSLYYTSPVKGLYQNEASIHFPELQASDILCDGRDLLYLLSGLKIFSLFRSWLHTGFRQQGGNFS